MADLGLNIGNPCSPSSGIVRSDPELNQVCPQTEKKTQKVPWYIMMF